MIKFVEPSDRTYVTVKERDGKQYYLPLEISPAAKITYPDGSHREYHQLTIFDTFLHANIPGHILWEAYSLNRFEQRGRNEFHRAVTGYPNHLELTADFVFPTGEKGISSGEERLAYVIEAGTPRQRIVEVWSPRSGFRVPYKKHNGEIFQGDTLIPHETSESWQEARDLWKYFGLPPEEISYYSKPYIAYGIVIIHHGPLEPRLNYRGGGTWFGRFGVEITYEHRLLAPNYMGFREDPDVKSPRCSSDDILRMLESLDDRYNKNVMPSAKTLSPPITRRTVPMQDRLYRTA